MRNSAKHKSGKCIIRVRRYWGGRESWEGNDVLDIAIDEEDRSPSPGSINDLDPDDESGAADGDGQQYVDMNLREDDHHCGEEHGEILTLCETVKETGIVTGVRIINRDNRAGYDKEEVKGVIEDNGCMHRWRDTVVSSQSSAVGRKASTAVVTCHRLRISFWMLTNLLFFKQCEHCAKRYKTDVRLELHPKPVCRTR